MDEVSTRAGSGAGGAGTAFAPAGLPSAGEAPGRPRRVPRAQLVNLINRVNFRDGEIFLAFRDGATGACRSVPARPDPCRGEQLTCRWPGAGAAELTAGRFRFEGFVVDDGHGRIQVAAELLEAGPDRVRLALPAAGFDVTARSEGRHPAPGVVVAIAQGATTLAGELASFSASTLTVRLPPRGGGRLAAGKPATVTLLRGAEVLFAEECRLIRAGAGSDTAAFRPAHVARRRSAAKGVRADRQRPRPLPILTFTHPLTGRPVSLRATDVSGAGFAIEEDTARALLLPGLLLPEVRIEFFPGAEIACRAQVLYGRDDGSGTRRSGLAILDMDPAEHVRLCAIVHRCRHEHSHVCTTNVDLDALLDFFFKTGFLYPEKYAFIKESKQEFLALYERLYHRAPSISRHFIYQDRGAIYGHVSMFRFYRRTWILHHHAAIKSVQHNAGMVVQEQILHYINEFHHLPAARMRYIACYYRPNNRYAGRVLGGAARSLGDQRRCSLDAFAYFHRPAVQEPAAPPPGWSLEAATAEDLREFAARYRETSGGLLDEALDLGPQAAGAGEGEEVDREYAALGFTRERRILALRREGALAALLVRNRSDLGLNLSELTNSVQLFVLRPELATRAALEAAIDAAAAGHRAPEVPVLLHPRAAAEALGLASEKTYELCIVDLEHYGAYLAAILTILGPRTRAGRERRG